MTRRSISRGEARTAPGSRRAFHPRRGWSCCCPREIVADARDALVVDWNRHVKILVVVPARRVLARARQDDLGVRRGKVREVRASRRRRWRARRVSRVGRVSRARASRRERSRRRRRERWFPDASSRVARRVDPRRFLRRRSRRDLVLRALASRARHRVPFGRLTRRDEDPGAFADPESAAAARHPGSRAPGCTATRDSMHSPPPTSSSSAWAGSGAGPWRRWRGAAWAR